ncbi:aminoglycoside N(3)-acetyltransferase [Microbispora sp. NPDC049125]|uniref:aminoglycoside N(3)-acetyltransferase n=1 Tax=Microbispora sp. NPDC049125 TaxID=3154929 RepID=UPI0034676376
MLAFDAQPLARDLRALGVARGQTLLVHASLRDVGRVRRGPVTVVQALRSLLGRTGTLVVPTHTAANSDTSRDHLRAIEGMAPDEVARFRARMPAFDPARTPSNGMGRLAEYVRTSKDAVRSVHPQTSFAAIGRRARPLMEHHSPRCHLGEESPLARLYEVDAHVLLLGVGYEQCSVFHLGEYRCSANPPRRTYRCKRDFGHGPEWWEYKDVVLDDRDFSALGADFESTGAVRRGVIGKAPSRLFRVTAAVDFATQWLTMHRYSHESSPSAPPLTYAAFP